MDQSIESGASPARPGAAVAPGHETPDPTHRLVAAAEALFGEPVRKVTAPGGRRRESLRIHFADRTVIATRRPRAIRREREVRFLTSMAGTGAPVPDLLGEVDDILFQSDAGPTRLTSSLVRAEGTAREDLAARSFESLWTIKAAARQTGVLEDAVTIAMNADWLGRFAVTPRRLAKSLGVASPTIDWNGLAQSLAALPTEFIKWDARPGNASVGPDGGPIWFDWEHYGRRGGSEDFAFLIADEFWPLEPEASLRVFAETCPRHLDRHLPLLTRFSAVQITARLLLIHRQFDKHGWSTEERARRYDRIGTAPELVQRLCDHGEALFDRDPLTRPAVRWFDTIRDPDLWT